MICLLLFTSQRVFEQQCMRPNTFHHGDLSCVCVYACVCVSVWGHVLSAIWEKTAREIERWRTQVNTGVRPEGIGKRHSCKPTTTNKQTRDLSTTTTMSTTITAKTTTTTIPKIISAKGSTLLQRLQTQNAHTPHTSPTFLRQKPTCMSVAFSEPGIASNKNKGASLFDPPCVSEWEIKNFLGVTVVQRGCQFRILLKALFTPVMWCFEECTVLEFMEGGKHKQQRWGRWLHEAAQLQPRGIKKSATHSFPAPRENGRFLYSQHQDLVSLWPPFFIFPWHFHAIVVLGLYQTFSQASWFYRRLGNTGHESASYFWKVKESRKHASSLVSCVSLTLIVSTFLVTSDNRLN